MNHLTAVRVYRRLAEHGYVTATVGRGTFVRRVPPSAAAEANGTTTGSAVLPERAHHLPRRDAARRPSACRRTGRHLARHGLARPRALPGRRPGGHHRRHLRASRGGRASTTSTPVGLPELREELAERGRAAGFAESPEEIVSPRARARVDLVSRAVVLGPATWSWSSRRRSPARSLAPGDRRPGHRLPVDEDGLDVDALERVLARHEVKLVALQAACENPTGRDLSAERRERLVELARERSFFVLDDGVYATCATRAPSGRACARARPATSSTSTRCRRPSAAACASAGSPRAGPSAPSARQLKIDTDIHTARCAAHRRALPGERRAREIARGACRSTASAATR